MDTNLISQSDNISFRHIFYLSAGVGGLVFVLSVIGIATRPQGLLAAFWPANAVLMGLLIRFPVLNHPLSWVMAIVGYLMADNIYDTALSISWFLSLSNLVGVVAGVWLYSIQSSKVRQLKEPIAVLYLLLICAIAACLAGLVAMIGYPIFWGGSYSDAFTYWFSTELANYLAILPLMLTFPNIKFKERRKSQYFFRLNKQKIMALATLIAGILLGKSLGGPSALSFLIPGLLWCVITFSVFATSVIILASSLWVVLLVSTGMLDLGVDVRDFYVLESFRLGVIFIMLSPLTVACAMAARNSLARELAYTATHDHLTHALNRTGFYGRVGEIEGNAYSALLCDIDCFKTINDSYGHEAGDMVLAEFSRRVAGCLREDDIFARTGSGEFCILLPHCTEAKAFNVADRLRFICSENPYLYEGKEMKITLSIGIFYCDDSVQLPVEQALSKADIALNEAKRNGRDQIVTYRIEMKPAATVIR